MLPTQTIRTQPRDTIRSRLRRILHLPRNQKETQAHHIPVQLPARPRVRLVDGRLGIILI